MANEEHLAILRQGAVSWNEWRKRRSDVVPDLAHAKLAGLCFPAEAKLRSGSRQTEMFQERSS